jgi:hypothetical protein
MPIYCRACWTSDAPLVRELLLLDDRPGEPDDLLVREIHPVGNARVATSVHDEVVHIVGRHAVSAVAGQVPSHPMWDRNRTGMPNCCSR